MDFALDDDQALIVQTVRRFVDKDVRGWAADADRAAAAPAQLAAKAGELGFFLDAVPEAGGGLLDGDYAHLTRALRGCELGRGCSAMAALLETNVEPALAVARWGSPAAQAALFASLAAGGLATTARDSRGALAIEADGAGVRVSGKLGPLPALAQAGHVLLIAQLAGAPVVLLVPTAAGRVQPLAPSGWRAAAWGTLTLEAAAIAADHVVARGAAAADAAALVLAWYRTSLAARAAGVAVAAMEHARKYAAERIQFGQPIGRFESLIGLRDDAETGAAAVRLMALHAAWLCDRARDATSIAAAADAASRARVLAGDVVRKATIDAVQIFGGYGFVNDYPVEKLMRDARAYEQLVGDERFDRILADPALAEESTMDIFHDNPMLAGVRQMLAAFAKQQIRPVAGQHDREESMPWALMKLAQGFGMTQTAVVDGRKALTGQDDEGAAGKPKSQSRLGIVGSEELAYGCAGICLAIGGSGLAASPVARMGTDEQKQEFRRLLKGEDEHGRIKVAAMALSEPSTGSDISGLSTTARADGDHWVLSGHKQWITNGQSASAYVVWAQTNPDAGRAGVRGFLVARGTPGLVPGRKEHKLGIRASETAQVHFEDCRVHRDLMLGGGAAANEGLADTKKMLDSTRPMVGAQAVGIARAAFDYLVERIAGGTIHGTALKQHQHVTFQLAEMEMEIQAARALVHKAAWMADHHQDNVRMASIAKAYGAKVAQDVTSRALTLLGEEALEPDHPVEKWYRDAKIYDIFEGTGQIQRRIIARSIFGVNPT